MKLRAYYDTTKPERTLANVMTTGAGFVLASRWHINWLLLAMTLLGTTLIIMSACAANNVLDRGIDARMPRTRKRPTVTGDLPARNVTWLSVALGVAGFAVLSVWTNWLVVVLGLIGYVDYVVLYGWTKRTTVHSTLVGTISGAVPIMAGYSAVTGRLDATVWLLALAMVCWQMPHFYAIGIFRHDDYKAANLPIWPVRKGVRSTQKWLVVYTTLYALAVLALGVFGKVGVTATLLIVAAALYWLWRGTLGSRGMEPVQWARSMFGLSFVTLLVLCGGVALPPLLP